MIDLVTDAVVAHLARETRKLGDWIKVVEIHHDAAPLTANALHVALYAIDEHGHMRNLPLEESPAGLVRAPLHLRLSYVMTYVSSDHREAQKRLARVVEVFHTTPILRAPVLAPALAERVRALTVRLRSPSLDERNQLWTAFSRPMRLALYYEVDVAPVPVTSHEGHGRIDELEIKYEVA